MLVHIPLTTLPSTSAKYGKTRHREVLSQSPSVCCAPALPSSLDDARATFSIGAGSAAGAPVLGQDSGPKLCAQCCAICGRCSMQPYVVRLRASTCCGTNHSDALGDAAPASRILLRRHDCIVLARTCGRR
jgi:hypothetical protein